MLRFREIVGWALVSFAIFLIFTGLGYVTNLERPKVVEATAIMFVGLGVMRAGIMLIRLATAARIYHGDQASQRTTSRIG